MDDNQLQVIDAVVRNLRESESILFVTGAGMSADSGMPTYRGIGGLYDIELTEEGIPIEEVLSGPMFRSRPELTWKYLAQIADAARASAYNRGHEVIVEMERHFPRVWTLTQNVDGFHRSAGSRNLIEIHGNMRSLLCTDCDFHDFVDESDEIDIPPLCPECSAMLRPDVVLFGEMLPDQAISQLYRELEIGFDLVFSVGTSSVFPYIQEPLLAARRMGGATVEINPRETVISTAVDHRLAMSAAQALDEIWRRFLANS